MKVKIINSKGHWKNGWISHYEDLEVMMAALERNGIEVSHVEVDSLAMLNKILSQSNPQELILPNAYYVDVEKGSKEKAWLVDIIESYGLPVIGSDKTTLQNVLRKDVCQKILKSHGIPIPEFAVVKTTQLKEIADILRNSALSYPAVVKLTAESGSKGMTDDSLVDNEKEATQQIHQMITTFRSDVIIEDFLPSTDITVGYYAAPQGQTQLLTTYYAVEGKPGETSIMGQKERFMSWGDLKQMTIVRDEHILSQVRNIVPEICKVLNIRGVTRVDGRLDSKGQLRIFDVNGFPALVFPESVQLKQASVCFSHLDEMEVYEALLNTIVMNAAQRYNIKIPKRLQEFNLFQLSNLPQKTFHNT